MIRNYFKVALRSLFRNRLTAFINVAGLALAMTSAILIYLFVVDELSYDKYHANADRAFRVTRIFFNEDGGVSLHLPCVAPPVGPLLKSDFGEIELMARTLQYNTVVTVEENGGRRLFTEQNLFLAEPALFQMLDIPILSGNPSKDFGQPFKAMLSESTAMRYFNTVDVVGKHLLFSPNLDIGITGVFKDFPKQTHWHPDFLVSFVTLEDNSIYGRQGLETNWGNNSFSTYLLLHEGTDPAQLAGRFPAFLDDRFGTFARANWGVPADWVASKSTELTLQNVQDIHLHSHLDAEIEVNGNINTVYMMSVIGGFIVLIACFNFINLSTARASKRAKEVGLRKVVGAFRTQLIGQYLTESVMISLFALVLSAGLAAVLLDWLNAFTGKELSFSLSDWKLPAGLLIVALIVGVFAGIYPALVISGFKPALVLKGQHGSPAGKAGIRKVLVVSQFGISIVLLIATVIAFQQLKYLNSRDLGYDREQVVTLTFYRLTNENYEPFYNELVSSAAIKNVTRSSRIPTGRLLDSRGEAKVMKGDSLMTTGVGLKYVAVDQEFFDTYGVEFAVGRNFSKSIPTDDSLAFIINEAAVQAIGWLDTAEGIDKDFEYGGTLGKLIGVVKDFHFESLHEKVSPMIFVPRRGQGNSGFMSVKIINTQMQEGLAHLEKVWRTMQPERPFEYRFLDDRYRVLYESEQKEGTLFTIFSGLAIFIACLGLFGLATFNTMQRVKEIGIRKVLGASVPSILRLLSREIVVLIIVANAIAWPVAWLLMGKWLDTFAYHIQMNPLVYALAAGGAIILALVTVSAQTIRAAMTNPANTLRYE